MMRVNPFQALYAICNEGSLEAKASRPRDFPVVIDIELTNRCNLKCLMCPTGTGAIKRPQGFMADSVFGKILDELRGRRVGLRFIRWGEPLLHSGCMEYFGLAKEAGVLCHFNTNGHLLTEDMMRKLIAIRWDSLKFSFQGVDARSYNAMRRSGSGDGFGDLMKTIRRFHVLRGASEHPYIHVASTVSYEPAALIDAFKADMARYADLITVGRTHLDHIHLDEVRLDAEDLALLREARDKQSMVKVHPKQCPEVFDKLSINWDGTVTACCGDYDGAMILGDVRESSIKEIWEGDKLHAIRAILARRDYDALPLCRECYDYMGVQSSENKV